MPEVSVHPLTPDRWDDLTTLFGEHGAYSGCWCMWWRIPGSQFSRGNAANRAAFKELVDAERVPGLLAYSGGVPVGWVSVAPREEFGRLNRSPRLKAVDDTPVWSIVCFFIQRGHRNQGVATQLIEAAVAYAGARGAVAVEAYPIDTRGERVSADAIFTGALPMFQAAGFVEIARRAPKRPILRKILA